MLEWLRSNSQLLTGAALALISSLVPQFLALRWTMREARRKFLREKLVDIYCQIATLIAADIDHAKDQVAKWLDTPPVGERAEWAATWTKIQIDRSGVQRKLYGLSFQVRLLERDRRLANDVKQLADQPPFVIPVGDYWEVHDYLKKLEQQVADHEKRFHEICDQVLAVYGAP
jgi:hypothetical protein